MIGRSDAIKEVYRLKREVNKVSPYIDLVGGKIAALKQRLDELGEEADEKAEEFRQLYDEAEEAYTDGDHERAGELSEEGKDAEDECREMNDFIARLRLNCQEMCRAHKEAIQFAKSARSRIKLFSERLNRSGNTQVHGFGDRKAIYDDLDKFPMAVVGKISKIVAIPSTKPATTTPNAIRVGKADLDTKTGLYTLRCVDPEIPIVGLKYDPRMNLSHEIGHVVWDCFVKDDEKKDWEDIYISSDKDHPRVSDYAENSTRPDEDFCETLAWHMIGEETEDDRRANLLDNVMSRIDLDITNQMGIQPPEVIDLSDLVDEDD